MDRNDAQKLKELGFGFLFYCNPNPIKFSEFKDPTKEEMKAILDKFNKAFKCMGVVPKKDEKQT